MHATRARRHCKQKNKSPQAFLYIHHIPLHFLTNTPTWHTQTHTHTHILFSHSVFAFGHRQFDTTGAPRAMWMSVCVCLSLCGSLCDSFMSLSLQTTSQLWRLLKSPDSWGVFQELKKFTTLTSLGSVTVLCKSLVLPLYSLYEDPNFHVIFVTGLEYGWV